MTHSVIDSILLRRVKKVILISTTNKGKVTTPTLIGTILMNIKSLGFVLSPEGVDRFFHMTMDEAFQNHDRITIMLKESMGAPGYKCMYPNFPRQVAEAESAELYLNAILHYCGDMFGVRILPEYETLPRPPLVEELHSLIPLGVADDHTASEVLLSLLESKIPPSVQDREDLAGLLTAGVTLSAMPVVPCRETLAYAMALAEKHNLPTLSTLLIPQIKTATDVLRLMVALQGGDASLTEDTRFKAVPRKTRRMILGLLEHLDPLYVGEDMMRFREKFKRLGECLHPGEFKHRYPNTYETFRAVRNEGCATFYSRVDACKGRMVIDAFAEVVDKVSSPVLWQLKAHLEGLDYRELTPTRFFFPKGNTARVLEGPNRLVNLNPLTKQRVLSLLDSSLQGRYRDRAPLGKVWIDPLFNDLLVPMGNRSAQSSLRQVGRGSRFPITKETIRLFMFWKDLDGDRVDLDLGVTLYDKDWNAIDHCGWTNLRSLGMYHSGDITSAPTGAAEYLDVHLPSLAKECAYVAATVVSYSGQKFSELNEGFAGWMVRENPNSGELFEPRLVEGRVDVRCPCTALVPMIIDVHNYEIIWADMSVGSHEFLDAYSTTDKVSQAARTISELIWQRPHMIDVLQCHIRARGGEITWDRTEADFVAAEDGDLNFFDVATFAQEWL